LDREDDKVFHLFFTVVAAFPGLAIRLIVVSLDLIGDDLWDTAHVQLTRQQAGSLDHLGGKRA